MWKVRSMKVIDANTGQELHEGQTFVNVMGTITVNRIVVGWRSGYADIVVTDPKNDAYDGPQRVPLIVRYMHPTFLFQKVAFFPS